MATRFRVISQVSSSFVSGDDVDLLVKLEGVEYAEHLFALLTAILGIGFRDVEPVRFCSVIICGNRFYDYFATEFDVFGVQYSTLLCSFNLLFNRVLLKL